MARAMWAVNWPSNRPLAATGAPWAKAATARVKRKAVVRNFFMLVLLEGCPGGSESPEQLNGFSSGNRAAISEGSMLVGNGATQVDGGEHREHEGLDQAEEEPQEHHGQGQENRHEPEEDPRHQVLTGDVAEETQGMAEDATQEAEDLQGKHEGSQPPDRTREMGPVLHEALLLHAVEIVVGEHHKSRAQGHVPVARAGTEGGNQAEQVIEEDEQGDGPDERQVLLAVVGDIFVDHVLEAADHT